MLSRHGWPNSFETRVMALKSMGIPLFTSATSRLKFAHERCVSSSEHEGTPAWAKAKPSPSRRSHWKTYRPVQLRIYIVCVELAIFVGKDSVPKKFSLYTHHMIDVVVVERWRHSDAVRLTHSASREKTGACTFTTVDGGDSDTCHQDYEVTWQRRLRMLSIQASICF